MNELKEAAKAGGKSMTFFGVIAIIPGILAMLTKYFCDAYGTGRYVSAAEIL